MLFFIIVTIIISIIYFYNFNIKEKFQKNTQLECWQYGNDYNSCYSNPNCTIGFLQDGSTHCMKKFFHEDI